MILIVKLYMQTLNTYLQEKGQKSSLKLNKKNVMTEILGNYEITIILSMKHNLKNIVLTGENCPDEFSSL